MKICFFLRVILTQFRLFLKDIPLSPYERRTALTLFACPTKITKKDSSYFRKQPLSLLSVRLKTGFYFNVTLRPC
jgi:hypothetical protein